MKNQQSFTIVSLNTWGGRVDQPLKDFFKKYASLVDVFCLQEVLHGADITSPLVKGGNVDLFNHIQEILADHQGYYLVEQEREEGSAMFIRKSIMVEEFHEAFIHRWQNAKEEDGKTMGRGMQVAILVKDGKKLTVAHFHGLWNGGGKNDSEDRIEQSKKAKEVLTKFPHPQVLMGDFNLNPDTESLRILEEGKENLIKKHGVTSTRTSFYPKENKFADYALVTPDLEVASFEVLADEVSDHSALLLTVSV